MKDLKTLATMLLLMVLSVGFTACGDDDDEPKGGTSIVGTWVQKTSSNPITFVFTSNNSGYYSIEGTNGINLSFNYIYDPSDKYLKIIYYDNSSDEYEVRIQGNSLYLSTWGYSSGATLTFTRQ